MRTLHLLNTPDILLANDSRLTGSFKFDNTSAQVLDQLVISGLAVSGLSVIQPEHQSEDSPQAIVDERLAPLVKLDEREQPISAPPT